MKITSDMQDRLLSFEDLQTMDAILVDRYLEKDVYDNPESKEFWLHRSQLSERFTHTFLEWNLYENYVSHKVWHLNIVLPFCDNKNCFLSKEFIDIKMNVDTIEEVEALAIKKISQILGCEILLVPTNMEWAYYIMECEIKRKGVQRGTLFIDPVKESKYKTNNDD